MDVLTRPGFGGEALSLQIPFDDSDDFGDAGYADFVVDGDVAGKTRQAGLLSFTRVFQAGHEGMFAPYPLSLSPSPSAFPPPVFSLPVSPFSLLRHPPSLTPHKNQRRLTGAKSPTTPPRPPTPSSPAPTRTRTSPRAPPPHPLPTPPTPPRAPPPSAT